MSSIYSYPQDVVKVRNTEGEKISHQKRLVLSNLKELHVQWKNSRDQDKTVGFSTFASLRPPWCILAGASGTHSVCVCKYHQNPKLMVAPYFKESVHDLMSHCVCSTDNEKCMMGQCKNCPGVEGIKIYISNLTDLAEIDEIEYKQWVTTDRTTLITIKQTTDDYIDELAKQLHKLTRHSYTAKTQGLYMKSLKSTVKPWDEIILQGDFAENYAFVVQDEIQSFHWENRQATLHPFVAYRREDDGKLVHRNICVMSDSREHSTTTVWTFQNVVLDYIKIEFPELKKVHYFTDGCAGQYKNKSNFLNLCHHKEDFGLEAEWNFFATSHGKSACDGIGGTVKRLVTKESLHRPYENQILTSTDMFEFCKENITGIKFIHVEAEKIKSSEVRLEPRFSEAKTIKGTLKLHRFVPQTDGSLLVYKTSTQEDEPRSVSMITTLAASISNDPEVDPIEIGLNNFVSCVYDGVWWLGMVNEISDEFGDFLITFMHPHGPSKQFHWPDKADKCWIEELDVLCLIEAPSLTSSSSRKYAIPKQQEDTILAAFNRK